ncbi:MAG: hypothetical protein GXY49_02480 [Syntrophomonadaceae bacterium]|nr:hypothetical protein [Syntrophomonadaceae bacterium]
MINLFAKKPVFNITFAVDGFGKVYQIINMVKESFNFGFDNRIKMSYEFLMIAGVIDEIIEIVLKYKIFIKMEGLQWKNLG